MKITPTIGRVVLFRPLDQDYDFDKRHAAIIAQVNVDGTLNLGVLNDYGVSQAEQNIVLVQGDDKPDYGQCEWMDYQKSQAEKSRSNYPAEVKVTPTDVRFNFIDERLKALEGYVQSIEDGAKAICEKENPIDDESLNLMSDVAKNQAAETVEILDNPDAKQETYGEIETVDVIEEAEFVVTDDDLVDSPDGTDESTDDQSPEIQ